VLDLARLCFRVDTDLRPEGRDGPLVRSVAGYATHWERWAQPWELQALLKARPVAGDPAQGAAWAAAAESALWSRRWDADDIRSIRDLKRRAEAEVARGGSEDREVKRGPGGIRDVEFSLQLLQLVHGRLDEGLRSPTTLQVLSEMQAAGYVDPDDADQLAQAYRFLRRVEHALQLEDEQQVHAVPASVPARTRLARVLGRPSTPTSPPTGPPRGRSTSGSGSARCSRPSPAPARPSRQRPPRNASPRSASPTSIARGRPWST
jgi:glutamate-ammonia-ligase adenylyltransferase